MLNEMNSLKGPNQIAHYLTSIWKTPELEALSLGSMLMVESKVCMVPDFMDCSGQEAGNGNEVWIVSVDVDTPVRPKIQELLTKSKYIITGFPSEAPMVTKDKKPGRRWEKNLKRRMSIRSMWNSWTCSLEMSSEWPATVQSEIAG